MINPKTGNRIKMVSQDAQTGEEVARRDTVKGYEYTKGQYVIITDEDMESVKVESSGLMKVEKFVDAASIDPIYYDASYYLAPDGKGSEDVYAVLREAIERTGKVALTRVVMAQRERTIALRALDGGLVAHTLNEQRDLNPAQPLFEGVEPRQARSRRWSRSPRNSSSGRASRMTRPTSRTATRPGCGRCWTPRSRARASAGRGGAGRQRQQRHRPDGGAAAQPWRSAGSRPSNRSRRPSAARSALRRGMRRQPGLKLPLEGGKKAEAAGERSAEPRASRRRA